MFSFFSGYQEIESNNSKQEDEAQQIMNWISTYHNLSFKEPNSITTLLNKISIAISMVNVQINLLHLKTLNEILMKIRQNIAYYSCETSNGLYKTVFWHVQPGQMKKLIEEVDNLILAVNDFKLKQLPSSSAENNSYQSQFVPAK